MAERAQNTWTTPTTTTMDSRRKTTPNECNQKRQADNFKSRRRGFVLFATYTILAIVLIELVLVNPNLRPVEAKKKKKIIKKIKEILPLIALLKRKKIVLLPIPM